MSDTQRAYVIGVPLCITVTEYDETGHLEVRLDVDLGEVTGRDLEPAWAYDGDDVDHDLSLIDSRLSGIRYNLSINL